MSGKPTLPALLDPLVNRLGQLIPPWNIFFQNLINPPGAAFPITPEPSPFSYTASQSGYITVAGGTVSDISIQRGPDLLPLGIVSGIIPLAFDDIAIITYSVAPTINFVPA